MPQQVNADIAARLDEVADLLHHQGANPYRVDAYRKAATVLRRLAQPVADLVRARGIDGLKRLPGVGDSIARSIYRILVSGRLPMLDRLRGESDPVELLATIPGIGRVYSDRICEELGIETLEELEIAAYDGRLAALHGMGGKRITGIQESLAMRLGRVRQRPRQHDTQDAPVAEILDVDREYLAKAKKHSLPTITPRRFNPKNERWLPVLHTTRGERHYTALFSNTGRAHQMGMTRDWVVIYYNGQGGERQCTVITSQRGALLGRRIIRSREGECAALYAAGEGVQVA